MLGFSFARARIDVTPASARAAEPLVIGEYLEEDTWAIGVTPGNEDILGAIAQKLTPRFQFARRADGRLHVSTTLLPESLRHLSTTGVSEQIINRVAAAYKESVGAEPRPTVQLHRNPTVMLEAWGDAGWMLRKFPYSGIGKYFPGLTERLIVQGRCSLVQREVIGELEAVCFQTAIERRNFAEVEDLLPVILNR